MGRIRANYKSLPANIRKILALAGRQENGVPKGLTRCPVCGDWIGRCLWPNPLPR